MVQRSTSHQKKSCYVIPRENACGCKWSRACDLLLIHCHGVVPIRVTMRIKAKSTGQAGICDKCCSLLDDPPPTMLFRHRSKPLLPRLAPTYQSPSIPLGIMLRCAESRWNSIDFEVNEPARSDIKLVARVCQRHASRFPVPIPCTYAMPGTP